MYCKKCFNKLNKGDVRCLKCGYRVKLEDMPTKEETSFIKMRAGLIIVAVLIIIILIAINM